MTPPVPVPAPLPPVSSPGAVLQLVRSGRASSRSDVARQAGLSPSTAAARVEGLIRHGYLLETGAGPSRGGRRPRQLALSAEVGVVAAVDLGERHATLALVDTASRARAERHLPIAVGDGPDAVLAAVLEHVHQLVGDHAGGSPLLAVSVGVPGPVDSRTGLVVSPARMPGWNGADVRAVAARHTRVPVLVENDANLMALGEHEAGGCEPDHVVFVKIGSGIGCGIIASGSLHRGGQGFAGDISHAAVPDALPVPCSCGRVGCLDAVASGTALVHRLHEAGVGVEGTDGLLELAHDAHPLATALLREAGTRTGVVLSTIIDFFNPQRLVVGGHLSQAGAFVSALRSAVYARCLPMVTDALDVRVSLAGQRAGVRGGAQAALDHVLSASLVDAAVK